jgi:hypothetical protein
MVSKKSVDINNVKKNEKKRECYLKKILSNKNKGGKNGNNKRKWSIYRCIWNGK